MTSSSTPSVGRRWTAHLRCYAGRRLVALSAPPPAGKADEYRVTATFFIVTPNRDQLAELAALLDRGQLKVEIANTFALADGRQAFESGTNAHRRPGKTVIIVRD